MAQGRAVTEETTDKLLAALRLGMTRRAAAAAAGIGKSTLYRMLGNDQDGTLGTLIEKAEGEAEATFSAIVANAAADPKNWTAAAWWLERRHPADYAKRERVEMTGPDGGPIESRDVTGTLSDTDLRAALREAERIAAGIGAAEATTDAPAGD